MKTALLLTVVGLGVVMTVLWSITLVYGFLLLIGI